MKDLNPRAMKGDVVSRDFRPDESDTAKELRKVADMLRGSGHDRAAEVCDQATLVMTLDAMELAEFKTPLRSRRRAIDLIKFGACEFYEVEWSKMMSRMTDRKTSKPRHAAMYIARERGYSWLQIGNSFERCRHSVRNVIDRIDRDYGKVEQLTHEIDTIRRITK